VPKEIGKKKGILLNIKLFQKFLEAKKLGL